MHKPSGPVASAFIKKLGGGPSSPLRKSRLIFF